MKKRNNNLSYMRAIACLAIVLFHTFQAAAASLGGVAQTAADTAAGTCEPEVSGLVAAFVIGRNLMLWAVPCFVMVTGALMLSPSRDVSLGKLFKRYIWRVLRALLIFSAVYEVFDIAFGLIEPANPLLDWAVRLVTGTSWSPLWYLYMMIGLYLMLPVFQAAAGGLSRQKLVYTVILLTAFQSVLPVLTALGKGTAFYIPVYTVYPLYLFAGWLFVTREKAGRKVPAVLLGVISAAAVAGLTLYGFFVDSELVRGLISDYSSLPVVVLSLCIFGLLAGKQETEEGHRSGFSVLLLSIDKASFGIYLVHIIFVNLVFEVGGFSPAPFGVPGGFLVTLLLDLLIFIFSFLLVAGFQRLAGAMKHHE